MDADRRWLVDLVRSKRRLLAITGAGISAESGIPTYRGITGLYASDDGAQIMRDLSAESLARRPAQVWSRIQQMADRCRPARPNPAHLALAHCERWMESVAIFTQNVDGLHRAAGSRDVVELHGNLFRQRCDACGHRAELDRTAATEPRACPSCEHEMRFDVVLFGELLPERATERLRRQLTTSVDVCLVVGTTGAFPYVVGLAQQAAATGAVLVEINLEDTPLSPYCVRAIRGKAGEVLAPVLELAL